MKLHLSHIPHLGLMLLAIATAAPAAALAETFVGTNVDNRVTLAFNVDTAAAQAWLPQGWTVDPVAKGALAGTDLLVVFVDHKLGVTPDKKAAKDAIYRGIAFAIPAKHNDESRGFVVRVYASDAAVNPYKNTVGVTIGRKVSLSGSGNDPDSGSDKWTVDDGKGGTLSFHMSYRAAVPQWSEGESLPYSSIDPDVHRIYRYQQIATVLQSRPAGIDRVEDFAFSTSIAELAPMFDGHEQLIGIINIPWYLRHLYLP